MPTSSTVWWASMCRSPLALDRRGRSGRGARSGRACGRGTPMPVASSARPVPSRLQLDRRSRVSAVLRSTCARADGRSSGAFIGSARTSSLRGWLTRTLHERVEQRVVLLRRADGEPQAVGEQRMQPSRFLTSMPRVAQRREPAPRRRAREPARSWPASRTRVRRAASPARPSTRARSRADRCRLLARTRRHAASSTGTAACVSALTLYGGRTLSISSIQPGAPTA